MSETTFVFSLLGGILPALLWLWFWLREDGSPEPKDLIIGTFFAGMIATFVALYLENSTKPFFLSHGLSMGGPLPLLPIALWAFIEEVCKFGAAYWVALRRRENDEPVDNMIYLITAALGFAALETAFFLVNPLSTEGLLSSLMTSNLRFIGTLPLHIVCSACVGVCMAFAFCKMPSVKNLYTLMGICIATLLHTLFNFFILKDNANLLTIFAIVWVGVIVLLLFFERVKRINRSCVY